MSESRSSARRTRSRIVRRTLPVLALITAMTACGDPEGLISRSIYTQAAQGPGAQVRIVELMPFDFDRMWIFPPATPAGAIRDSLGVAGAELDDERLNARGDSTLLVFVRGSRLVLAVSHPPSLGEFHPELANRGLRQEEAVFRVDSASAPGRPVLRPAAVPQ